MNIKDPQDQLTELNRYVNLYYSRDSHTGSELVLYLQRITGLLYYLETVRSEVHDAFQNHIYECVKSGQTVARAENEAHVTYSLMYSLRRIMDAGYRVADAIRTHISYLKSEQQHNINP
jgi:hypothetical protein